MKRFLSIMFFLGLVMTMQSQSFCLNLTEVSNDGTNYVVKVEMQGDAEFDLGSSNLQFSYENAALGLPTLLSSPLAPPFYFVPTVTQPDLGEASLNIELGFPDAGSAIAGSPGYTELATISFPIIDAGLIGGMSWSYNGGTTETVVFLEDEATQLFAASVDCLLGIDAPVNTPVNDLCAGALLIACDETATGTTELATADATLASCGTTVSSAPGVWYSFLGNGNEMTINTDGSGFDTKLGIYEGTCEELICIDTDDDDGEGLRSQVIFTSELDVTYYAYVTGFSTATGNYLLNIICPEPVLGCTNENACNYDEDATEDDDTCILASGCDVCDGEGGVIDNDEIGTPCDDGDDDTIDDVLIACDECAGTPIIIIEGCTDALACNFDITANTNDGSCLIEGASCDDGVAETLNDTVNAECLCVGILAQGNDICGGALPVTCGENAATGSTDDANADASLESCGTTVTTAPGVWHSFVGTGAEMTVNTNGSDYDTKLGIYGGSCEELECIDTDDDGGISLQSLVTFASELDVTYYAYITGFGANTGNYVLNVICEEEILGCTDIDACNFDSEANTNDESCVYANGCDACNEDGTVDDNPEIGDACDDGDDFTINDMYVDCGLCLGTLDICFDPNACNFNDLPQGVSNNGNESRGITGGGSCLYAFGCDECSGETDGSGTVIDNPEIGDACDDGDDNTENDMLIACDVCEGTPIDCDAEASEFVATSETIFCNSDDIDDTFTFDVVGGSGDDSLLVATTLDGTVLAFLGVAPIVFNGANVGDYLVYHMYFDETAMIDGDNITDLIGCYALSNPVALSVVSLEGCASIFDCPDLELNINDACDDLDANTENDLVGDDCTCAGTPIIETPENDLCQDAAAIACGEAATGSTAEATIDAELEGCASSVNSAPGVWYSFIGTGNEMFVNTIGSTYDTKLGIYGGTCEALDCISTNDDFSGLQSGVIFDSELDVIYYAYVTGFSTNTGDYILNVECQEEILGCTDENACNFNELANSDDESCIFAEGCDVCDGEGGVIDNDEIGNACNDGDDNTENDVLIACDVCEGTPIVLVFGCTDGEACNFDATANTDDGSCTYGLLFIPIDFNASDEQPAVQACVAPEGYVLGDQDCLIATILEDSFCIETDWDDLCNDAYLECLGSNDCQAIESSMWGEGPWTTGGTQFTFVAENANDAVLAQGDGDVSIEIFDGVCGGNSLGVFNNYGAGLIERAVPGNLIAGNTYSYFVSTDGAPESIMSKVKKYAVTLVEAEYCNSTMELIDQIYCSREEDLYSNPAVNVVGFSFKFVHQISGDEIFLTDLTDDGFYQQLTTIAGFELGATYDVSANHQVIQHANGTVQSLFSDYGPSCPVTIETQVPLTNVKDEYCSGATTFSLADQIQAENVVGADQYEWIFDNGVDQITHQTVGYPILLWQVPGLEYGMAYTITVRAHLNGNWGVFGNSCTILMDSQPNGTKVRDTHCGLDYLIPSSELLFADVVFGATEYTWEFNNGSSIQEFTTGNYKLLMVSTGLSTGFYDVRVKAFAGGVYGDYAMACEISINGGGPGIIKDDADLAVKSFEPTLEATIYPNPNTGDNVSLNVTNLSNQSKKVIVEVMDIFGKKVYSEQLASNGSTFLYELRFVQNLPAGLYLVQIQVEGKTITEKLVVE